MTTSNTTQTGFAAPESLSTGNVLSVYEQRLSDAVDRSRSHTESVRVEVEDPHAALGELRQLYAAEDVDYTDDGRGGYDVWASDDDALSGMAWRVYLVTPDVTAYTWRLGADEIDPHATIEGDGSAREAAHARFCQLAEAWLTEHEGDALSISVRPLRSSEIAGLYLGAGGRERSADPDHDEARELTDAAYEAAWAALNAELQAAD